MLLAHAHEQTHKHNIFLSECEKKETITYIHNISLMNIPKSLAVYIVYKYKCKM